MTLLIDNTDKLKAIMEFNPSLSYYKFVCLIREKDYKDKEMPLSNKEKQEILVKQWLVDSQESLDKQLPDMLKMTDMFKCRLYMCLDRKSTMKTLVRMRNQINNYLDPFLGNDNPSCSVKAINKVTISASSISESSDKLIVIGKLVFEYLYCNDPVLHNIVGLVNVRHSSNTDKLGDLITSVKLLANIFIHQIHSCI